MLRRLIVFAALAAGMSIAAAITLATPALAKGPSQARITGPGLARPIVVSGNGEPGQPGILGTLALQTKLFSVMFGPNVPEPPQLRTPPAASLGPRYTIVYTVYGEFTRPGQQFGQIRQDLYPRADGGPVIYTPQGQPGGRCRSPDGSGPVATCPAPLPSSAFHRVRAHRQPPDPSLPCRTPSGSAASELTNPCLAHRISRSPCRRNARRYRAVAASPQAHHRAGQPLTGRSDRWRPD
jgi:hypothetical protein